MSRLIQVRQLPPNQHQLALELHKQVLHAEVVARFPTAQGVVAICRELVPRQSVVALQMYDLLLLLLLTLSRLLLPLSRQLPQLSLQLLYPKLLLLKLLVVLDDLLE
jgi:hypothetical protein